MINNMALTPQRTRGFDDRKVLFTSRPDIRSSEVSGVDKVIYSISCQVGAGESLQLVDRERVVRWSAFDSAHGDMHCGWAIGGLPRGLVLELSTTERTPYREAARRQLTDYRLSQASMAADETVG